MTIYSVGSIQSNDQASYLYSLSVSEETSKASLIQAAQLLQKLQIDQEMLAVAAAAPQAVSTVQALTTDAAAATAVRMGASKGVQGSGDDTPDDFINPFDPNNSILTQLMALIDGIRNHVGDSSYAIKCLTFLAKICKDPALLSKYPQIMELINSSCLKSNANGNSIFQHMIDTVVEEAFFSVSGGSVDAVNKEITNLRALFPNDPTNAFNKSINDELDVLSDARNWNKDAVGSFAWENKQYLVPGAESPMDDIWGESIKDYDISHWMSSANVKGIDYLIAHGGTAALMFIMMFWCGGAVDSLNDQLSGYGDTTKWMQERTTDLTSLQDQFAKGFTTPAEAKKFIEDLNKLRDQIDSSPYVEQSYKDQMEGQIDNILTTKVMIDKDPSHDLSLQDWYDFDAANGTNNLLTALNDIFPGNSANPVPPQYSTIVNNLKLCATSVTDQSAAVTTKINFITNTSQVDLNVLKASLTGDSGYVALESASVKHQAG